MKKQELKDRVIGKIDRDKSIRFLRSLIRLPSQSGQATLSQELVLQFFEKMNMRVDMFHGNDEGVKQYADYCPLPAGESIDDGAYNLVGVKKGRRGGAKSLMLFSHIDTEAPEPDTPKNVYEGEIRDGKLYGLGAADAKSGIATMLLAAEAVLSEAELDGDLLLMSILGKKGGSAGTLSAIERGYTADGGVYIHSAETGHGFREIKCYSMGTIDFRVLVDGAEGVPNDELDNSEINAVVKGAEVVTALIEWDKARRGSLLFEEGTYAGQPKTKLHIGLARGGIYVGKDPLSYEIQCRLYFGYGETIASVLSDLEQYLDDRFADDPWLSKNRPRIEQMYIRATPARTDENAEINLAVRKSIGEITGLQDLIYQYHGASDIRLPVVYGNIPTVGIGPKGGGIYGQEWTDWVDIDDFIDGIKIAASLIIDWCIADS